MITCAKLCDVIDYDVTSYIETYFQEGHMMANHPGNNCAPSCSNFDLFVTKLFILNTGLTCSMRLPT